MAKFQLYIQTDSGIAITFCANSDDQRYIVEDLTNISESQSMLELSSARTELLEETIKKARFLVVVASELGVIPREKHDIPF